MPFGSAETSMTTTAAAVRTIQAREGDGVGRSPSPRVLRVENGRLSMNS